MKKVISLVVAIVATCLFLNVSTVYGQCDGEKMGIAIVKSEDGSKPETPKSAMKFPRYEGGSKAMCKYICDNMKYPETLKRQNVKGVTTIEFVVSSSGTISEVEVVNSSGQEDFDKEALRLVNSFPKWKPAEKECSPIDMKTQVNIEFDCDKCGCGKK